ncbi:Nicotinate-nucleotide adenylyltransferase [Fusobacterium necrogenes]|uniref:Probable nicotinate-nucleotide adenylyltransferase n=1 Tax=Fusobacterium necrogenes TaxID=858 RepID=A0A377GVQ4_9FUSO|nr:nicotinate (nicotinamide) nucleotide adenylyltransferase [Fusobacterium necrogenes]STO31070.1 Nicotinate-nucleotide adenylyltransferase [Fusobacterium necrogenes]
MKIGIYGGSFNPIHKAHVEIVNYITRELNLDKVIIIPVGKPSHRNDNMLSGELRKKMCELAFEGKEKVIVSDIEIKNKKTSYTIDTLKKIISFYGGHHEFYEIVGEDSAYTFPKWKDYKQILTLSKLVIFRRKGYESEIKNKNIIYLNTPYYDISSTLIRKKLSNKENIDDLLPKKVAEFIKYNNLYQ